MEPLKLSIATIGCRANQADSSRIVQRLNTKTVRLVQNPKDADIHIVNTCCVTTEAERDCRKMARRALAASPDSRIVLIGCAVNGVRSFGVELDDRVEIRRGEAGHPDQLAAWINELAHPSADSAGEILGFSPRVLGRTRALLKIQNGCTHGCAYCIVPRARGKERSLPEAEVLTEAARLVDSGFQEIVLCGVQLGAWGTDLPDRPHLADIATKVADLIAPGRLRLSSIEPWSIDARLIAAVAEHDRICPHLHIPLQSGDDSILAAMGRGYTASEFIEKVASARREIPDLALGTDVILGFPGEDEPAFSNTLAVLQQIEPTYVHAFTYSPRPGTRAARLENRPPKKVAKNRTQRVRSLGFAARAEFHSKQSGNTREILVEENRHDVLTGLTDNYIPVEIKAQDIQPGEIVWGRLAGSDEKGDRLHAVLVPRESGPAQ